MKDEKDNKTHTGHDSERDRSRKARQDAPDPPRTTKDGITAPKFGSAGGGGAELEPGPEKA